MAIKNESEIQILKLLFKTQKKKPTKNLTSRRGYPHGVEQKYYRQLKGFFKPLTDYVQKYINENSESLLKGDSKEIKLDAIPGPSFRKMIYNLEDWLSIYMPDIADLPNDSNNNVIFTALGKTADETMNFGEKEFERIIEQGIHVNMPTSASWWDDMKTSWMEDNYTLITSNAKNYVSKINTLTEQAIVNGFSMSKLAEQIKKATSGLSDKHCKLLARDQIGKLNGQINQAQMQEFGLDLYVWSTAFDDRVRDSHSIMEGLLCRWDDASIYSEDNGKTWIPRPSGAVLLHPGQDIQCRCVALTFYPELISEMEGKSMEVELLESPALSTSDIIEGMTPEVLGFTQEEKKLINDEFEIITNSINNKGIRKYIKQSFNTESLSNSSMKAIFNQTIQKMNKPYFLYNNLSDEKKIAYYKEKMIHLLNPIVFKDKTTPIHEIIHAFSELNRKNYKPLSRSEEFIKAFHSDFSKLLKNYGEKNNLLNSEILKLYNKNHYEYLPIVDLIGGFQGKSLINSTHGSDYWTPNKIYDEAFAEIGQAMFDKKRSTLIKKYFPESYNIIRKCFSLSLQGKLVTKGRL